MPGRSPAPGQVAQLVEHAAENRGVGSSILPLATPVHSARPEPVTNADEARACADDLLTRLIRVWLANRGVWEAIVGAGPVVPVPATDDDVDAYLVAWDELLQHLAR